MIGTSCDLCGDEVFIIKEKEGKRLCLDCVYQQIKQDKTTDQSNIVSSHNIGVRYCPNCGRNIPLEAIMCCYCGKKF